MEHTVTTSWRRRSDGPRNHPDEGVRSGVRKGKGGTLAPSTVPVRILIVDNDMSSADSLDLMETPP